MKKTLLTTVLAATLFTTGLLAANTKITAHADVNHTVYLYHFKKVGKHYVVKKKYPEMIFSNLKHTGKAINYQGQKYYYNPEYQGYLASKYYHLSFKKKAKKQSNTNTTDNSNNDNNNQSSQSSDKIVDGFDETTSTVVDQNTYINAFKNYMIQNINNYRQSQGLQPLTLGTGKLEDIAMTRAQQILTNFTHYDSNGQGIAKELSVQDGLYPNYTTAEASLSENIAAGALSDEDVFTDPKSMADGQMNTWIAEKTDNGGHYLNLISPNSHRIGIGLYIGNQDGKNTTVGYAEDYQS